MANDEQISQLHFDALSAATLLGNHTHFCFMAQICEAIMIHDDVTASCSPNQLEAGIIHTRSFYVYELSSEGCNLSHQREDMFMMFTG